MNKPVWAKIINTANYAGWRVNYSVTWDLSSFGEIEQNILDLALSPDIDWFSIETLYNPRWFMFKNSSSLTYDYYEIRIREVFSFYDWGLPRMVVKYR